MDRRTLTVSQSQGNATADYPPPPPLKPTSPPFPLLNCSFVLFLLVFLNSSSHFCSLFVRSSNNLNNLQTEKQNTNQFMETSSVLMPLISDYRRITDYILRNLLFQISPPWDKYRKSLNIMDVLPICSPYVPRM